MKKRKGLMKYITQEVIKKIVIFGSTGMIGLCALEAAVKKGYKVRAFVRDEAKVPSHLKDKIEVIKGDVLEPDSVIAAVEGVDGVVVLLGTRNNLGPTTDMSEGMKNIIDAMKAKKVKNLSTCMTELMYTTEPPPPRFVNIHAEHDRMITALKESGLLWIVVFSPHVTGNASGKFRIEVNPFRPPGEVVSKWDLGAFMVDCLGEPIYIMNFIGICNEIRCNYIYVCVEGALLRCAHINT